MLLRGSLVRAARSSPTAAMAAAAAAVGRPLSGTTTDKPVTAQDFAQYDAQLRGDAEFQRVLARYSAPASEESVARAVQALKAKKHDVHVVDTKEQALSVIDSLLKPNATYSSGGSTTATELDVASLLKRRADVKNLKGLAIEAAAKGDSAKQQRLLREGACADVFLSSVSALTEDGEFFAADLSGTRIHGWLASGRLVLVAGTNKIVRDATAADLRLFEYQWKLESARARYAFGVPGSAVVNKIAVRQANPMGPRTSVVLVKKSLGF